MGYFPLCVELTGKPVLLVGHGPQIREKAERLSPFGAALIHLDTLTAEALTIQPAFVVAGDLSPQEAERTAALCAAHRIPLNVVDQPRLCTFSFPAMMVRGDVTISVSTGGKAPGAAACLKERIQQCLPERTEAILNWLADARDQLRRTHPPAQRARLIRALSAAAFDKGDALSPEEYQRVLDAEASV